MSLGDLVAGYHVQKFMDRDSLSMTWIWFQIDKLSWQQHWKFMFSR